jgi:glyoxylase-like metal-dependent hydrolase (beta-lactamase superfamily II)
VDAAALCTGDTLFLGRAGQPDLDAAGTEREERARLLYTSLRDRVWPLDGGVMILPGHASRATTSAAGAYAAPLAIVRARVALTEVDEDAFVAALLSHTPEHPPNHAGIVRINEGG